jgi:hypothetical protein
MILPLSLARTSISSDTFDHDVLDTRHTSALKEMDQPSAAKLSETASEMAAAGIYDDDLPAGRRATVIAVSAALLLAELSMSASCSTGNLLLPLTLSVSEVDNAKAMETVEDAPHPDF